MDLGQVERLADLARLALTAREAERFGGELSSILDYFAALDKVDVSRAGSLEEASKDGGLREDVVYPSIPDEILRGVPRKRGRYVKAPRVF